MVSFMLYDFSRQMLLLLVCSSAGMLVAYVLGRILRRLGYGEKMDKFYIKLCKIRQNVQVAMHPVMLGSLRVMRGLHSIPILGSKQQRQYLEQWEAQWQEVFKREQLQRQQRERDENQVDENQKY